MKAWKDLSKNIRYAKLAFGFNSEGLGLLKKVAKSNCVSVLAFAGVDAYSEFLKEESIWSDIGITFASGIVKSAVSTGLGLAASGGIFTASAPIWIVSLGAVGVGVVIAIGLDWLDNQMKITDNTRVLARRFLERLNEWWDLELEKPAKRLLNRLDREIMWLYFQTGTP